MKLLWLDLESTGLDPKNDRILEVACFVTDLATPFARGCTVEGGVLPLSEGEVALLSPFILDMHTKNGLLLECLREDHLLESTPPTDGLSLPPEYANAMALARYIRALGVLENRLLALIPDKDVVGRENITALAGSSVHFDRGFLAVHMPRLARQLSHRCYDVSAVKLFCRSLGMPKPPPEEAHRAVADIEESFRHAKGCVEWLESQGFNGVNKMTWGVR